MAARKILAQAFAITAIGLTVACSALLVPGAPAHAQGLITVPVPTTVKPPANAKPSITGNPSRMLVAGSSYDFRPAASDPDSAVLTFTINKKPRWANFDANTGRLHGTPSSIDVGKIKGIQIAVSDGVNKKSLGKFGIKVVAGVAPAISGTPATTATEGVAYQFQPTASDADQQKLEFAVTGKPSWASFDKDTGRLFGTPPAGSAGTYASIAISVTDGATTVSLAPFTITVVAASSGNRLPTIGGSPSSTATAGQAYLFQPVASDLDGDALSFSASGVPTWLTLSATTGRLSGTPPVGTTGTFGPIVISVSDGRGSASLAPFSITVQAVAAANRPPTISGTPAGSVTVGLAYLFQPTASDPDGDVIAFGIANKPSWADFDIVTGRLSGTPVSADVGAHANVVISVSDGKLSATLPAFAINVVPPVIGSADLSWTAPTKNEDGSALTNLAGYKIRYGSSPGALTKLVTIVGAGITTAKIEGLAAGTWYFNVASYTNTGVESAPTGTVTKTIL